MTVPHIEVIMFSTTRKQSPFPQSTQIIGFAVAVMLGAVTNFAAAQILFPQATTDILTSDARLELPDAPGFSSSNSVDPAGPAAASFDPSAGTRSKPAGRYQMTILPNEIAQPMSVHDKIVGGLIDSVSPFSMVGWLVSAGWEQATNGSPNYGTNGRAFAQRLGASAARDASENIFADSFFAPLLHEDPRYYKMGKGHSFVKRLVYSGTRVLITKTDGGHTTPNLALLAGDAAGAALTVAYYPPKNTTFTEVASTFGGSLGGSALGFVATEFLSDALQFVHLKKAD
jgi:hypothetical protein